MKTCIECGESTPTIKMSGHNKRCDACIQKKKEAKVADSEEGFTPGNQDTDTADDQNQDDKPRRLKSLENGREFIWTEALAKRRDMIEI